MRLLQTFSVTASSVTLALTMTAVMLVSNQQWHQYKDIQSHRPATFWNVFGSLTLMSVISIGLGISLFVCSLTGDEKWIEILLLLFERFLLTR